MKKEFFLLFLLFPFWLSCQNTNSSDPFLESIQHGYADNNGVKLHYATIGEGPLVVMLHGFPDYWYTWREQMITLKDDFQVVAMDLRAYNLSDQPQGVENYQMKHLMSDVVAVIHSFGKEKAIVVGHDWGGAIAWQLAIHRPDAVEKLIVCNMTHPTGSSTQGLKALQANGNTSYMDDFRKHTSETLSVNWLSGWVKDEKAKQLYKEAFSRSYIDGMIAYYRANTRTKEQRAEWLKDPVITEQPKVQMPVLAIFGTQDRYVHKGGLNNTWDWLDKDFTLVTIPEAGHFVQQDASEMVSKSMKMWLLRDRQQSEIDFSNSPLKDMQWLLGTWKRERKGKFYYEKWTAVSSTTFEGKGFVVRPIENDTIYTEDILITAMGGDIYYMPKVKENIYPITFKLTSSASGKLIFEKPSHDFPQRIEYERMENGDLKAVISDTARNQEIDFKFNRTL